MKFFCVFVLACILVLQVADAGKGGKCGKYKGEMEKIAKDLYDGGKMPECTEKYEDVMGPLFKAKNQEEEKDAMKKLHEYMKNMSEDERKDAFECRKDVTKKIVGQMDETPEEECIEKWMQFKGRKNKEE